jgi:hypothetical protein
MLSEQVKIDSIPQQQSMTDGYNPGFLGIGFYSTHQYNVLQSRLLTN